MRCVTADLYESDNAWHFRELATQEHAHWIKRLRVWRNLDSANEKLCVLLDDLLLSWEQNHETQTLLLFMRGGTRLDCIVKFVAGTLDPTLCWLGAMVVAPHVRRRGMGTFYWGLTRAFVKRTHPGVERIALTPLEESKRFWSNRCGFAALPAERNTLSGVIKTLQDPDHPFSGASLLGIEVWETYV